MKLKIELPEIHFEKQSSNLNIEVMNFKQLFRLLKQAKDHNPFVPHKIKFYLILTVTKTPYTHYLDFKSYELKEGSTLFVSKNQVHFFNEDLPKSQGFAIVFSHLFVDTHYFLTDNLRLNRLFNYHIESPVIKLKEMGQNNLVELISDLHSEYYSESKFAKSEILASLLRVILLKAERAKELHAVSNIKTHWLETFSKFKDLLENEYIKSRNSRYYASQLFVSYKFLNDIVKKTNGTNRQSFYRQFRYRRD